MQLSTFSNIDPRGKHIFLFNVDNPRKRGMLMTILISRKSAIQLKKTYEDPPGST